LRHRILVAFECALFLSTLASTIVLRAQGQERVKAASFRIGVVADEEPKEGLTHLNDLLVHLGYPYDPVRAGGQGFEPSRYSLLIIYESGLHNLGKNPASTVLTLAKEGANLLWIGPGAGQVDQETLARVFGLNFTSQASAESYRVAYASSSSSNAKIFRETVTIVELAGAKAEGYFLDSMFRRICPSETYFRHEGGGIGFFFAYDVSSWWNVDLELPWYRPARLVSAIRLALSGTAVTTLRPYPRNFASAFICRIEDVDPLHTNAEWLSRAGRYVQAHAARNVPLSVALIPVHVDPRNGMEICLNSDSAQPVRDWLYSVIRSRGAIIQHGYTHQHGSQRTGVGTEFLVDGEWMSYDDQTRRISAGKEEIERALGTTALAFEAPHYKLNDNTLRAIERLGFKYLLDDPDSPFYGFRFSDADDPSLVAVPETLGYIPLGSSPGLEDKLKKIVDQLIEFQGILLLYNHLYDDEAFTIGVRTMEHALRKGNIWTPNINEIGRFALERAKAYRRFSVTYDSEITVTLGSCTVRGLTLSVNSQEKISWVKVNGKDWPVFKADFVILPELPDASNTVLIGFKEPPSLQSLSALWGLSLLGVTSCMAFRFAKRAFGVD